jgi:RNA polymerase sigma-70 factor (ECF subfamily)
VNGTITSGRDQGDPYTGPIQDFEAAVSVYRSKIFRFALASLRDEDAAETVTQDCLVKAHRTWHTFRRECSLNTWLMQIAVNLVRDYWRNRRLQFWKRTQRLGTPLGAIHERLEGNQRTPETQFLLKEQVGAVWEAAGHLPERQRTVFLLRFVEDMDILEIAAVTGLKEGTVKAHLFRALEAVRKQLGTRA